MFKAVYTTNHMSVVTVKEQIMWDNNVNGSIIRRIIALVLCALITVAYTPGMAYAFDDQTGDTSAEEEIRLEDCWIDFDAPYYNGEVPYYSVDSKYADEILSLDELGIAVMHDGKVIDAENYELKFTYNKYDETIDDVVREEIEPPFGVLQEDLDGGYAYTEYYVTAVAAEGSGLTGETDEEAGYFIIRDKHSLQFMGAVVNFDNAVKDSWRMRDRFWISAGDIAAPTVAAIDAPENLLKDGTDYILTYYETAYDPDENVTDESGRIREWWEYLAEDDEHKLDGMPTEPGHYFITIDGTGDYSGHGRALFDIIDYSPFNVDYSNDALWSDGTKELRLNIPDGLSGDIKLSGTANTDWGNTVFDFELSDDCYEYNAGTGKLVLDGAAVLDAVGRGAWLDLKIDLVNGEDLVARGLASFEVRESYYDYDLEGDRDMLPGWDGSLDRYRWAREESSQHPEGIEGDFEVLSVRVTHGAELLEADIDDDGYLQRDGDNWNYRIKDWSEDFDYDSGPVKLQITYKDLSGDEQSYTITLNIAPEIYEIDLNSDDNRYDGLPGHSFDMTAPAKHKYYDENGDYHDDSEDLAYRWSYAIGAEMSEETNRRHEPAESEWTVVPEQGVKSEFADFKISSGDPAKGTLTFKALTGEQDHDEFYVRVILADKDNDEVLASVWKEFRCHNEYTAIYPTAIEDLDVGDSTDYMKFEVRRYSADYNQQNGGYEPVDGAEFTWFFDENAVEIKEKYKEDGEEYEDVSVRDNQLTHGDTFKVTRIGDWDTGFTVAAIWHDSEDNEQRAEQEYRFNWRNYDIWFDYDTDLVFADGTTTIDIKGDVFEGDNWMEKFDIVYEAGTGKWKYDEEAECDIFEWETKLTEGNEYVVSGDRKTITLNGEKLKDYADQNISIMAQLRMKGSGYVVSDYSQQLWVREPWIDYNYSDFEMLPGWDNCIDGHENMHVENSEHPDGEDLWYEVTSVEVTDGAGFLDPDYLTTSGGKTLLKKAVDEGDSSNFRYDYRIRELKDLDPDALGDVTFKVNYRVDSDEAETGSFTFKVTVTTDIYEMHVESTDGRDTGLPGDTIDLKADKAIHKYLDEKGENRQEEVETDYEWYCEWGNEELFELNVDTEDSSIAHITLKAPKDRDDFWEGFGIGVRAAKGGKILTQSSFGLGVASDYTEIEPVRIDDLGIGESTDIELKVVRYSTTHGEEDITGDVQFRLFSEGGFIIKDSNGVVEHGELINGTHISITRTAHQYDRFDIRVEAPGSTIDKGDVYASKEYWFSYAEPKLRHYEVVYKNSDNGWSRFGDFTEGSTLPAAGEVDIVHDGKVLDPDYYDLKIFRSYFDEDAHEQKVIEVTDGVFTYYGNGESTYYVTAAVNAAGEAIGLEGETEGTPWIDLYSDTSLDPFGPEVYFEGRDTSAGPHPQRNYYHFEKGTTATPTVKMAGKTLTEGEDYVVSYVNEYTNEEYDTFPTTPGTYTCLIKPAEGSKYTGENGLVCVVVLLDDGTIGDIGYSEFRPDGEHPFPSMYYDASFDEKYRKLEQIDSTPYDDWFYVVPKGVKLEPSVKAGDKTIDAKYFKARYLEQEFDKTAYGGEGAWGPKDGAAWLDEFPTEAGVYFCKLEGQSPYYGTYESFDLIRIDEINTDEIIADAEAAIAIAEAANKAAETAQAAASSAAPGTADAVSKAQTAVTAAADAEKAAQQAVDAANAALEAIKAAGYGEDSDAYKAAEKAVTDANAVKTTAADRANAAKSALTKAQGDYNAEQTRQGIPDSKIPKIKGVKKPAAKKTSITVKWTKFTKAQLKKSKATKYEIWVCPNTAFGAADTKMKTAGKSKSSVKVSGLKKNTKYYVKVRAIRYVGSVKYVGKWSSRKTVKTPKK